MDTVKKAKTLKLATGHEVPVSLIPTIDKKRHKLTLKLVKKAQELQDRIINFKQEVIEHCDTMNEEFRKENNVPVKPNARGGYTISTIDKEQQIEFTVGSRTSFDDRIEIAKEKFFQYIEIKTGAQDGEVKMLIETAFQTTKGKLDPKKIFQLLGLKITHPLWQEAVALVNQSMSTATTKRYIEFRTKDTEGKYKAVVLDFAAL